MDFLERDLEDILFNSSKSSIQERGLSCFEFDSIFRQVNINGYGIIDLLTVKYFRKSLLVTIYELKNKQLNHSAFWQTVRYIKAIKHVLSRYNLRNHNVFISGVMIGREIDTSSDFCFLPTITSDISMFTYGYQLDGMKFDLVSDSYSNKGYTYNFNFNKLLGEDMFSFAREILNPPPF